MKKIINIHPGEILLEEFLEPLKLTQYRIAKDIGVQQIQIKKLIEGHTKISAEMASRLGKYFSTTAAFWLNLQRNHDLRKVRIERAEVINSIQPLKQIA